MILQEPAAVRTVPGARVPDGFVRTLIPPVPDGKRHGSWRRTVTGARVGERGVDAVPGIWLGSGCEVALPPATLVLSADKARTGTAWGRNGEYVTEDADCRAHLLQRDGTWIPLWHRHFTSSTSALGSAVVRKLDRLLRQHPAPGAEPVLMAEVQVPNRAFAESCRRCRRPVAARAGHLAERGKNPVIEHWPTCPEPGTPDPQPPATCDECNRPGRGYRRTDSSGIPGRVCARCNRDPWYLLSFA